MSTLRYRKELLFVVPSQPCHSHNVLTQYLHMYVPCRQVAQKLNKGVCLCVE